MQYVGIYAEYIGIVMSPGCYARSHEAVKSVHSAAG